MENLNALTALFYGCFTMLIFCFLFACKNLKVEEWGYVSEPPKTYKIICKKYDIEIGGYRLCECVDFIKIAECYLETHEKCVMGNFVYEKQLI